MPEAYINSNGEVYKKITEDLIGNLPRFYKKQYTDNNFKFCDALGSSLLDAEIQINGAKSGMFISTAMGEEIDWIGEYFNLYRFTGETDEHFRARIRSFIPGFVGGGIRQSFITNFWNRWNWIVTTSDIDPPIPKFKLKINAWPAMTQIAAGNPTYDEVIDYANMIKAAGVGFIPVFWAKIDETNGENILLLSDAVPILTESPLVEIFYDDSVNAYYDANGMYGWLVIYNGGFNYNSGWTYGGVYGIGYWDLSNWDAYNWGA